MGNKKIKQIKQRLHQIILMFPGGRAFLRSRASSRARRRFKRRGFTEMGGAKEVFQHHYESNTWRNAESVSGSGSTLQYTENIQKMIPQLVEELGVQVLLDAPCGDYNWFRKIEWNTPISYVGGDIVEPLIERNNSLYGTDNTTFISLDITNDDLPKADLWLCRDCLFHLSEHDIFMALDNFLKSDIRYLLTSIHSECDMNSDIPTGAFRDLNLQLPPFSLGKPIREIDDWVEGHPVRRLGLWEREAVENALASNKAYQRAI
jgi:hypothetical protein